MIKTQKKPKRKTISQLKKDFWKVFSLYIRMRDALKTTGDINNGKCITCGRLVPIKKADAGHFISRRYNGTLFDETNVHLQCKKCNAFGGILIEKEYRKQIVKKYGEGYDIQLEERAMEIKKFTPSELETLIDTYKSKIEALKEGNKVGVV